MEWYVAQFIATFGWNDSLQTYNSQGYTICGALNKFGRPCQRIGNHCPFHPKEQHTQQHTKSSENPSPSTQLSPTQTTQPSSSPPSTPAPSSPPTPPSSPTPTAASPSVTSPSSPSSSPSTTTTTTPAVSPQKSISKAPLKRSSHRIFFVELNVDQGPYKRGWSKEEHVKFLKGLQTYGRGSWKDIATVVGTRTPSQIQVHAHRVPFTFHVLF